MLLSFDSDSFGFHHSYTQNPTTESFILHNHANAHEILIFLKGDSEFHVEGSCYSLEPLDIVIARSFEMHRIVHRSGAPYERIIIMINQSFFTKNECEPLAKIFSRRSLGKNNKLPHDAVMRFGIDRIITQTEEYIRDGKDNKSVVNGKIIELLYNINKMLGSGDEYAPHSDMAADSRIKDIIVYINANLADDLSLNGIADRFFVTKSHLCRLFKQHTGYTVNGYITRKRLIYARELHEQGGTWMEASMEAGFGNYSNFYKMFRREYGISPKEI